MNRRLYLLVYLFFTSFFTVTTAAFANIIVDFKQSSNNQTSGPVTGLGNIYWTNFILQASNSKYYEGMSNFQRSEFAQVPATTGNIHTLTFSHQFTKGGVHAYDFLTSYAQGIADDGAALAVPIQINQCGQVLGPPASMPDSCNALHTSGFFVDINIPDDPYISKDGSTAAKIAAYEAVHGNRTIRIYGNAAVTNATLTVSHDVANGGDTGDSYALYVLTWTSSSSQILVEMAGHLAITGDGTGDTWGPGLGSSQINGGPYHFKLNALGGALDANGNQTQVTSLGSQDDQITTPCPVPIVPMYQSQDPWGSKTYDHADVGCPGWELGRDYFDTTIHRWGCALTSVAMLLRYYGVSTTPDGNYPTDPGSLNDWIVNRYRNSDIYKCGDFPWDQMGFYSNRIKFVNTTTSKAEVDADLSSNPPSPVVLSVHYRDQKNKIQPHYVLAVVLPHLILDRYSLVF